MFIFALVIILVLSIILSFWSLRNLNAKKEVDEVKDKLKKGKVLFQSSGSSSSK